MRKAIFFILLVLGGQVLLAQSCAQYKTMFWSQMASTCAPSIRWEKSVTEVAEDGTSTSETKTFEIDCYGGFAKDAETTIPLNPSEFGHLFEYAFDNPYVSPYLDLHQDANGITATVKAGDEGKSKLRLQRFETDPATGKLKTAEAKIIKGSALYDLEVFITVQFDAAGHYTSHAVETRTDVLLGGEVHTLIKARLL